LRGLGIGIGKILKPLGGLTEDVAWMDKKYPQVLKALAKHPHFAEHGKNATILADFYICGFMRGVFAETNRELVQLEAREAKRTKRK
jgi:hypothetical protein